jgi:hypothetical protein
MTNWPGKDGFYLFPALMTLTYAAISVLLVLHGKRKIKLAYDEIDPKLSRSLLILSFFSVTGILLLGEISLVLMNR